MNIHFYFIYWVIRVIFFYHSSSFFFVNPTCRRTQRCCSRHRLGAGHGSIVPFNCYCKQRELLQGTYENIRMLKQFHSCNLLQWYTFCSALLSLKWCIHPYYRHFVYCIESVFIVNHLKSLFCLYLVFISDKYYLSQVHKLLRKEDGSLAYDKTQTVHTRDGSAVWRVSWNTTGTILLASFYLCCRPW